jgi:CheY-like chemotaxis protein
VMQSPVSRQEWYGSLVELGLSPISGDGCIKVLIVDDDPKAVGLIAVRMRGLADPVLRAHGGRDAIAVARQELPDLIVLDLMVPEVDGFDIIAALNAHPAAAASPVVVVAAADVTAENRARLNGSVASVMGKTGLDGIRFISEVRRAMGYRLEEA